ncbi:MAG: glycosyltransferase family 4 protein [Deltaproteobacteria bacterium]|nr:glycosyltransferase family 4 protein [Deltaproteobacteria bacterium]
MTDSGPDDRRVLYLLRYYPTLTETFVYREMALLADRGWCLTVGTLGARRDGALQADLPPVRVVRPPGWVRILCDLAPVLRRRAFWSVLWWLWQGRRLGRALEALWMARLVGGFPRVHVHFAGEAGEWARAGRVLFGTRYSVMVHAVDLFKPRPGLGDVLALADAVLTPTRHNAALLLRDHGVEARIVPYAIPRWTGRRPEPDRQPLVVIAVARWRPKKGLDRLVDAVETLDRPVRLLLVSDAPAGLASARVFPLGLQPPGEVRRLLAEAGLFALPCRQAEDGDMDALPVALLEALSAGLPVLATRVSGIPEVVDASVGWLVPPDDPDALRDALREAADRPEERRARGARGPARLVERGCVPGAQADVLEKAWEEGW